MIDEDELVAVLDAPDNGSNGNGDGYTGAGATNVLTVTELIRLYIVNQGRATRTELRTHCHSHGFETEVFGKAMTMLQRNMGMLTEVTVDGVRAFELKKQAKVLTIPEIQEIKEGKASRPQREAYGDWLTMNGRLELTSPCLASRPVADNPSARSFLRGPHGEILFLSEYFARMFRRACEKPGAPEVGSAKYRVEWDQQMLPPTSLYIEKCPVPALRPGEQGRGVTDVEALHPGTTIPFSATFPSTHISEEVFATLMIIASRWCGFSPSGAHKGWGRFKLSLEPRVGRRLSEVEENPEAVQTSSL